MTARVFLTPSKSSEKKTNIRKVMLNVDMHVLMWGSKRNGGIGATFGCFG
jgi:hypothetical protein